MVVVDEPRGCVWELATWVAENAKNRKRNVPTNSPIMAMKWLRIAFVGLPGMNARPFLLLEGGWEALDPLPVKTKPRVMRFEDMMGR